MVFLYPGHGNISSNVDSSKAALTSCCCLLYPGHNFGQVVPQKIRGVFTGQPFWRERVVWNVITTAQKCLSR
jgi:hypothetical protein